MAQVINVAVDQGANIAININVCDITNTPVDLTYYSANASFRKHANAYANTTKFFTTETFANGLLLLSMTAEESANLNWGRYLYDVRITHNTTNNTQRVQEGILTIRPSIT
jgi:hypothetical protein